MRVFHYHCTRHMGAFAPRGTTMLLACKLIDLPAIIPEEKKHLIPINVHDKLLYYVNLCLIIDTFIHSYAVENIICHFRLLILTAGCLTLPAKGTCDTFSGQLPSPAPCEIRLCHNILKNYTTTAMNHFRLIYK